jgi:hypothetical protein
MISSTQIWSEQVKQAFVASQVLCLNIHRVLGLQYYPQLPNRPYAKFIEAAPHPDLFDRLDLPGDRWTNAIDFPRCLLLGSLYRGWMRAKPPREYCCISGVALGDGCKITSLGSLYTSSSFWKKKKKRGAHVKTLYFRPQWQD